MKSSKEKNKLKDEISALVRVGYDSSGEIERAGSFLVVDDKDEESSSSDESLVILPLYFAVSEYPWVKELIFSIVDKDQDEYTKKVSQQKQLLGSFIYVKKNARISTPAQSCFFLHNDGFEQILHNIIYLEEDSHLDVITGCATGNLVSSGRHLAVTETFIEKNSSLTFTMIHDWGAETVVYPRTAIKVDSGASYTSNYIALTRVKKIQSNPIAFLDEDATAKFNTIIYGRPGSFIDMGSRTVLKGIGSSSEIISRVVSKDSRIIAKGYIKGENEGTKGHMECNGLLLDEKGSIYAIPELEATHMDTELSHEASVGKIAGEKLNYLMSRGLDEETARALIIRGFLEEGIRGLPEKLQRRLDSLIEQATSKESI